MTRALWVVPAFTLLLAGIASADKLRLRNGEVVTGRFAGGGTRWVRFIDPDGNVQRHSVGDVAGVDFATAPTAKAPAAPVAPSRSSDTADANVPDRKRSATVTDNPRYQGRLAFQTKIEESRAANWQPPSGSDPIFTMDFVSWTVSLFRRELAHLVGQPHTQGLEIGSFEGRSAIWFLDNILTHKSSKITCVDLFGPRLDEYFDHNIRVTGHAERVTKLRGKSQKILRNLTGPYDFIYIDGCHLATCTMADIILSWDLLKVGGVLMIDDYLWTPPPLIDRPLYAVEAFFKIFKPYIKVRRKGLMVVVRKKSEAY